MSYRYEQKDSGVEIVIDGWEKGIASSPTKGLAMLKNVNTSTQTGEVMASFARVKQTQASGSGTLTQVNTNTVSVSGITLLVGQVITITNGGTTGLSGTYYYLSTGKLYSGSSVPDNPDSVSAVTGITAGTATFIVAKTIGNPFQYCVETYTDTNNEPQTRYFVLDDLSQVWCHDTYTLTNWDTPLWFYVTDLGSSYSGIAVYNGWLVAFRNTQNGTAQSNWRSTVALQSTGVTFSGSNYALSSSKTHVSLVGNQGKLYVTDDNFIASFFANTSLTTGGANIQSYCEYTAGATYSNISTVINGSLPWLGQGSTIRMPVVFLTTGTLPSAISSGTRYYLEGSVSGSNRFQFQVFAAASGGAALDMVTGATGKQYLNTFSPRVSSLFTFTPQRVNIPYNDSAQCLAEIGNQVLIGGAKNFIYPWDQIAPLPADAIPLPENNTVNIITVNNVGYVFAGNKGNIYITNGSSISPALSVNDYCAGIAGTPASYIEPYFTWGGSMFCRGRVYFSILDQTSTKTGNCGGVWSFVPSQNFSVNNESLSLRLENQNSYGTYNGVATILIPATNQEAIGPQYWSGWYSDVSSPTYGIDFSGTTSNSTYEIESDIIPTGTMLQKMSFRQLEYKLTTPLVTNESITGYYRTDSTSAWQPLSSAITESGKVGGYFNVSFQNTQWVQIKLVVTTAGDSTSSFGRLFDIKLR